MERIKPEDRKEHACQCIICKLMCKQSPCFPTPEEVLVLIERGHKGKLRPTFFVDPVSGRIFNLVAPEQNAHGCIFQDGHGECTLHRQGLKPLEGRLASHGQADNGLRAWVASKWDNEAGTALIALFDPAAAEIHQLTNQLNQAFKTLEK